MATPSPPLMRIVLYFLLGIFAFILFCLCCSRLSYTDHVRDDKSLFNGQAFTGKDLFAVFDGMQSHMLSTDPSIVELLISSMLALIFVPTMIIQIRNRSQHKIFGRAWAEIAGLFILWLFWIGGAGSATSVWPDLSWCTQYFQCTLLQTICAFAWLGWIDISVLLIGSIYFSIKHRGLHADMHDTWEIIEGEKTVGTTTV